MEEHQHLLIIVHHMLDILLELLHKLFYTNKKREELNCYMYVPKKC